MFWGWTYTLSISDDNFLLLNTCITYIIRIVSNILLWQPSEQEEERVEIEKREKIYIIKYKANKLCCYIDVHIWYKNSFSKETKRSRRILASFSDTHTYPQHQKKKTFYDLWYLKTLESILLAHIFKKFVKHSICSEDKTLSRDVSEKFSALKFT